MAILRKSLLTEQPGNNNNSFPSHCYMCYICPQDCYIRSPPLASSSSSSPLPPPVGASNGPHSSMVLILMLGLLGAAFLVLSYLTICRYRSSLLNSRDLEIGEFRDENQGPGFDHHYHHVWYVRTVGLQQAAIDSIPAFEFKKHGNLTDGNDCAVCLSEFQEDEQFRVLPKCGHPFHLPCIDPWLRLHTNCPVCRALVMVRPEEGIARNGSLSREENQGRDGPETGLRVEVEESREIFHALPGNGNGSLRALSDLAERWAKLRQESRSGRRTLSLDFSSEFMMNARVEKPNPGKRNCKNSPGRFLQRGPVAMKRSFSFGGMRSMRKNDRSRSCNSSSALGN